MGFHPNSVFSFSSPCAPHRFVLSRHNLIQQEGGQATEVK